MACLIHWPSFTHNLNIETWFNESVSNRLPVSLLSVSQVRNNYKQSEFQLLGKQKWFIVVLDKVVILFCSQMAPPIMSITTSHVTTRGNHVTAPARVSLLKTSVRSSASVAQSVSIDTTHTVYPGLWSQIWFLCILWYLFTTFNTL